MKEIDPGDAKLREAGFDPAIAPAEAIAKLRELRGAGGHDLAIARALGAIIDPGAAAMLAEMEAGATGALRREVRRALFRLKQHGIAPPPAAESPRATAVPERQPEIAAMLSPIDATGARIVWLIKPRVQGGVLRMQALVSEDEGLLIAENSGMSRRELKAEREELERRGKMKLIEADWRLADFIVCEAWRYTPERRLANVGNFPALRAELTDALFPDEFVHPIYAELAAEAAAEPSIELLKEPEFLEWRLPDAAIKPYAEEIARAEESTIVVSPIQRSERVNAVVERAAAELFAYASGRKIRRRLEDIAYYMARSRRRAQAGWAAGAAKRLRDGIDIRRMPFFDGFIRTQLGTIAAEEEQKRAQEPHLIMTPAEAIAAQQARQRRRG